MYDIHVYYIPLDNTIEGNKNTDMKPKYEKKKNRGMH
jgi:hypothetical protein